MEKDREYPDLESIKGGWAALGEGWAVHGKTKEEAISLYDEAIEKHKEIDARSIEVQGEEIVSRLT